MKRALSLVLTAALLVPLSGCGKPSKELKDVGEKAGETWEAAKKYAAKKKDDAMKAFSEHMEGMDEKLAAAKKKAAELGASASEVLDERWKDVSEKFAKMKDASGEKWEQARDGFAAAYEAFMKELDKPEK